MYKVHLPHLKSGYISKAYYEQATDSEGKRDWIMCYVPGPKAEEEFYIAHPELKPKESDDKVGKSKETPRRKSGPRQQRLQLKQVREVDRVELAATKIPAPQHAPVMQADEAEAQVDETLLTLLTQRGGISEKKARALLCNLKPDQQVIDQLEWGEHQVRLNPAKYNNPAGFYIHLIEENLPVPANFENTRKRTARLEEEARRREEERLKNEYEAFKKTEIDQYIAKHSHEFGSLKELYTKQFRDRYGNEFPQGMIDSLAQTEARIEIGKKVSVLSFDEFLETEKAIATAQLAYQPATETDPKELAKQATAAEPSTQPVNGTNIRPSLGNINSSQGSGGTEIESREELSSHQHQEAAAAAPVIDPIPPPPQTDLGSAL